jgi:hypothetical protein
MEETELCWNNLPMLFLHLDVASTGGVGRQVAWLSPRSLDWVRFMSGGRRLALSWVTILLDDAVLCVVLQLGAWMMAGGDVSLLRLCLAKLTVLAFGDHRQDPRPMRRKVSGSSLATARFIDSKSIIGCDGALPNIGLAVVRLFLALPWWRRRTMNDVLARHKFLLG